MIITLTGHRKQGLVHDPKEVMNMVSEKLSMHSVKAVHCGMASGFDLIGGFAAMRLGLDVVCFKPWAGHAPTKFDSRVYESLLEYASLVVDVNESIEYPGPWVYQDRNKMMVDNSTHVLAYWTGAAGGTKNCIDYARSQNKLIRNILEV